MSRHIGAHNQAHADSWKAQSRPAKKTGKGKEIENFGYHNK